MGFRWSFFSSKSGSPFDCRVCGTRLKSSRNCGNHKGLSEQSRAVIKYSEAVTEELEAKGTEKVFTLGDIRFYECPLTCIKPESWEVIRLIYLVDNSGHLLFEGGWAEQPWWLFEAYEIFRMETARLLEDRNHG